MEHLLGPCRAGNRKAQKNLYDIMSPMLMGICLRYLKQEEAEEALSNAFIKIFANLDSFKEDGSFEGWMKRIAVRECLTYIRLNKSMDASDEVVEVAVSNSFSSEQDYLLAVIGSLPTGYRTVFNLFAIEGYNHNEISSMLGISPGTSKSQLSKARKLLQERLGHE